jgi:predicted phosphodiesterase
VSESTGPLSDHRIAVIADIHANVTAMHAAVTLAEARGFDELIVLGDLLTYGCHVAETLDAAAALRHRHVATFIAGNHDALYWEDGASSAGVPEAEWVRESVEWTRAQLAGTDLRAAFPWEWSVTRGHALFAHANPFAIADWTYLNDAGAFARAAARLRDDALTLGIFGHTHRHRWILDRPGAGEPDVRGDLELFLEPDPDVVAVATTAGVGQPRDAKRRSHVLFVEFAIATVRVRALPVEYDVTAHLAAIDASGMSDATRARLRSYFGSR